VWLRVHLITANRYTSCHRALRVMQMWMLLLILILMLSSVLWVAVRRTTC
jgi:hypothetical protein